MELCWWFRVHAKSRNRGIISEEEMMAKEIETLTRNDTELVAVFSFPNIGTKWGRIEVGW